MTPKEKAEDLIIKFWELDLEPYEQKKCALIVVNEILNSDKENIYPEYDFNEHKIGCDDEFWEEVKQEIEKL